MTLRADIHSALETATPPAPHLPHIALARIRQEATPRRGPQRLRAAAGWTAGVAVLVITALAVGGLVLAQRAGQQAPAVAGSAGGWYEGALDAGGSSAAIQLRNDGRHSIVWRVFNGATTSDADVGLAVYTPDGHRYPAGLSTPPRIPQTGGAGTAQAGTWKFVVHNLTKGRLAWALELAAVPGTATQPLVLGTYDGSVPNLIGTVIPLAVVPGHRSVTVTLANGNSELLVSVSGTTTAAKLIHNRVTFTFDVSDGTACCYALVVGSGPAQDRHAVPITITYA
jgi:hypothetical protein